jgi:hypothetical protein
VEIIVMPIQTYNIPPIRKYAKSTDPLISVVIPTIGRHTLETTIRSIRKQANIGQVEILVIADSHNNRFEKPLQDSQKLCISEHADYHEFDGRQHCFGHPQRGYGQRIAHGQWVAYLQDDDYWDDNAYQVISESIRNPQYEVGPRLFQTETRHGGIVWHTGNYTIMEGNVDANGIVVPNFFRPLQHWTLRYSGDFDFIWDTSIEWGKLAFEPAIISRHMRT